MTDVAADRGGASSPGLPRLVAAAAFACFFLYYGLCVFRARWGGDFQMYCAGVAQLYRNFLHPAHEAMNVPGRESTVYTPYLVLVAGIGRLLGLTPYRALQLAGLVNLGIYVLAIRYFISRYSMHRHTWLAAACFLLVTLFLRWKHFGWSSETSLLTMQFVQAYPSTLAWALAFIAFALVEDFRRSRRRRPLIVLAAALCFLLLTHPITASWAIGIVLLRGLHLLAGDRDWRFPILLAISAAAAVALAALWPYGPLFAEASMTEIQEPSTFGRHPLADLLDLYLVAVPSALWLVIRVRRHAFFALGFIASFAALELWRTLGISFGNRYSFFMAFWAQFMVAEVVAAGILAARGALDEKNTALAATRPHAWVDRPIALVLLAAAALSWLPSPMWREARKRPLSRLASPAELWRRESPHDAYYDQFGGLTAHLGAGETVLMPVSRSAFDLSSVTGAAVVSSPNAHRVPDAKARGRDVGIFFSAGASPRERLAIAERYCATKLLLPRAQFSLLAALERQFGAAIYRDQASALFDSGLTGCSR